MVAVKLEMLRASTGAYVELDCDAILGLSFSWGATDDRGVLTVPEAGQCEILFTDPSRRYDPGNPLSDLFGDLDVGTRIRVWLAANQYYHGWIEDTSHDLGVATWVAADRLARLAGVRFTETSAPAETADARVRRIFGAASVTTGGVTSGGLNLQAGTYATDGWSDTVKITQSELGTVWVDRLGNMQWRPRSVAWAALGAPILTLGCTPSDAELTSVEVTAGSDLLRNSVTVARRTGTARPTQTDTDSITRYQVRSHVQNDLELANDADADAWAAFMLTRQKYPPRTIRRVRVTDPPNPFWGKLVNYAMGAPVRVVIEETEPPADVTMRLIGWDIAIGPVDPAFLGNGPTAEVSMTLAQDAALRPVSRRWTVDTEAEWNGWTISANRNMKVKPPGVMAVDLIPPKP
jgi:hypothetical protein